jgi:hypothetical protein
MKRDWQPSPLQKIAVIAGLTIASWIGLALIVWGIYHTFQAAF